MPSDQDARRQELRSLYESYDDEVLLDLAREDLTEVAREVVMAEISSRHLEAALDTRTQESLALGDDKKITIWSGRTIEEAVLVMQALKLYNVETTLMPFQGVNSAHRFAVHATDADAKRAIDILAENHNDPAAEQTVHEFLNARVLIPQCPACKSEQVTLESVEEGNCWSCQDCNHRWDQIPNEEHLANATQPIEVEDPTDEVATLKAAGSRSQRLRNKLAVTYVVLIVATLLYVTLPLEWSLMRIVGLATILAGELLWAVARLQLGASFTGRAAARRLVTTGVYSRIQNPIYLGGFLGICGFALWWRSLSTLFIAILLVPVQLFRIRNERRVLAEHFGEAYTHYRTQTWF